MTVVPFTPAEFNRIFGGLRYHSDELEIDEKDILPLMQDLARANLAAYNTIHKESQKTLEDLEFKEHITIIPVRQLWKELKTLVYNCVSKNGEFLILPYYMEKLRRVLNSLAWTVYVGPKPKRALHAPEMAQIMLTAT